MKIYTRTGDDGSTGLIGGRRLSKSDLQIDCYGTVDELNAILGGAAVYLTIPDGLLPSGSVDLIRSTQTRVLRIQNELFVVGSHLAIGDAADAKSLPPLETALVERLEGEIDAAEALLPPLKNFILPGGTPAAAGLHLARTVCRRAERLLVALHVTSPINPILIRYTNRLADWLFVQARLANLAAGVEDVIWRK